MKLSSARILASAALLASAISMGGCIVSDQLTTVAIHPDGSADVVVLQTNVHSSESGAKAEEELRRYVEDFNSQKDAEHVRLKDAGAQVQESRLIRNQAPYSSMIVARLPAAESLEKAFTFKGDKGESFVTARFSGEGRRRKFSLQVTLPAGQEAPQLARETAVQDLRANQANGLSETRFAVTGGKIVAARGFTVAEDKQSALLEPKAILELLRSQREVEAFIEWEVAGQ